MFEVCERDQHENGRVKGKEGKEENGKGERRRKGGCVKQVLGPWE